MIQGRATEERARAYRQAFMTEAEIRRNTVRRRSPEVSQRSVTDLPVSGRAVRRPGRVTQRVGSWLINAGTRLGGASISPS